MKTLHAMVLCAMMVLPAMEIVGQISSLPDKTQTDQRDHALSTDDACQASFKATPDSLSSFPYLYHFNDLSTGIGLVSSWHWDFGDGTTSTERNPSHQYEAPGTYRVCLVISGQNDTVNCDDEFCFDVATLNYYSLGGLVYAGDYPLNNPDNQGDVGIASLYRLVNDQIVFVEDQTFQEYGYFWFGYLFPGDYMVKVGLTPESPSYDEYFTTYYGDEVSWTKADILSVSSVSQFDAEVHLAPVQELAAGAGTIKGYVKFEQGNQYNMPPIAQTNVILADKNHVPLLFTHPNAAGYFEFSSLPVDSYYLSADATGKPSSTVLVTLTQAVPVVEGINLPVFGSNISFIPDETSGNQLMIKLFPNPAADNLYISMYSVYSDPIEVTICDITGKIQHRSSVVFEPGTNTWVIPVNNLPAGIYLLRIQQPGILQPVTARFIK